MKQKKRNKWRDAIYRLLDLAVEYPELLAGKVRIPKLRELGPSRKLVFGVIPDDLYPDESGPAEYEKMVKVLSTIAHRDAAVYSLILQAFLASQGLSWPEGVFKNDFAVPDSGRPLSEFSVDAWHHFIPRLQGWRSLAEMLIPEEFKANPEKAANKVRKAARGYMNFQKLLFESIFPPDKEEHRGVFLDDLLATNGLFELFKMVETRKFEDALSDYRAIETIQWRGMLCLVGVKTRDPSLRVDLRLDWAHESSSIVAAGKRVGPARAVNFDVADRHKGADAVVVVVDAGGKVLERWPTRVGETDQKRRDRRRAEFRKFEDELSDSDPGSAE